MTFQKPVNCPADRNLHVGSIWSVTCAAAVSCGSKKVQVGKDLLVQIYQFIFIRYLIEFILFYLFCAHGESANGTGTLTGHQVYEKKNANAQLG